MNHWGRFFSLLRNQEIKQKHMQITKKINKNSV